MKMKCPKCNSEMSFKESKVYEKDEETGMDCHSCKSFVFHKDIVFELESTVVASGGSSVEDIVIVGNSSSTVIATGGSSIKGVVIESG